MNLSILEWLISLLFTIYESHSHIRLRFLLLTNFKIYNTWLQTICRTLKSSFLRIIRTLCYIHHYILLRKWRNLSWMIISQRSRVLSNERRLFRHADILISHWILRDIYFMMRLKYILQRILIFSKFRITWNLLCKLSESFLFSEFHNDILRLSYLILSL